SWKNRSGTNTWSFFTIDVQRGIVYAPLGAPTSDYYGGDRHGKNLYGNSLVALDANTGKLQWYQQLVHHDIWDFDVPAAPTLVDAGKHGGAAGDVPGHAWRRDLERHVVRRIARARVYERDESRAGRENGADHRSGRSQELGSSIAVGQPGRTILESGNEDPVLGAAVR